MSLLAMNSANRKIYADQEQSQPYNSDCYETIQRNDRWNQRRDSIGRIVRFRSFV